MNGFPEPGQIDLLIELAMREDLGAGDVTSGLLIPEQALGEAVLVQRQAGVAAGLPVAAMVCRHYDPRLLVQDLCQAEGTFCPGPRPLLRFAGPLRSLLAAERVVLNFLQHLSGVATLTRRFVQAVAGTPARIYDTRKTTPGMRLLEKYAVRCGGGHNHRMGLYDAVLVKDNHLATLPPQRIGPFLRDVVQRSRREDPRRTIEVEVDTLQQLQQVLGVEGIDIILLDNMDCASMRQAVRMRDEAGLKGALELEASGGVTLQTVREIAQAGVERIAVGAITHSAPALDIGLDLRAGAP